VREGPQKLLNSRPLLSKGPKHASNRKCSPKLASQRCKERRWWIIDPRSLSPHAVLQVNPTLQGTPAFLPCVKAGTVQPMCRAVKQSRMKGSTLSVGPASSGEQYCLWETQRATVLASFFLLQKLWESKTRYGANNGSWKTELRAPVMSPVEFQPKPAHRTQPTRLGLPNLPSAWTVIWKKSKLHRKQNVPFLPASVCSGLLCPHGESESVSVYLDVVLVMGAHVLDFSMMAISTWQKSQQIM
jgi:hypothetical protein